MDKENMADQKQASDNDGHTVQAHMAMRGKLTYSAVFIMCVVVIDQFLKWAVLEHIIRRGLAKMNIGLEYTVPRGFGEWLTAAPEKLPYYTQDVLPFFNITMVWNQGVSFGLFSSDGDMGRYILIAMAMGISGVLGFLITKSTSRFEITCMAAVIGGAIGNIIDRVRFGAVADFIDVHAYGYHFPVFNVADSAITIGIALLMVYGLFLAPKTEKKEKKDRGLS